MQAEKLVRMTNQIATFFATQPQGDPAERTAGHLRDTWSPQMRRDLKSLLAEGGEGLSPIAKDAAGRLA
ncbi:formate dehydrogenase subunit delta [Pseudoroseicyclus sp. H15]